MADLADRYKAIEIKAGKTIPKDFTRNLYSFKELASKEKPVELFLIYGGDAKQQRSDLLVLPWAKASNAL